MREISKEIEFLLMNMLSSFSESNLHLLKLVLNLLIDIYDAKEFLEIENDRPMLDYVELAIEASIQNFYKHLILECEEAKDPVIGDPIGTNTSAVVRKRQRSERRLSAEQLMLVCQTVASHMDTLPAFEALFTTKLELDMESKFIDIIFKQLQTDIKLFIMKYANQQQSVKVLNLGLDAYSLHKQFAAKLRARNIDDLPVGYLFTPFIDRWLQETEEAFKNWIIKTCREETWEPIDASAKKLWSHSATELHKMCVDNLPFVKSNETMYSSENDTTLLAQYSKLIARILKEYIENIYNYFVGEFPEELHSDLHDLYIREYFNNFTS